MKVRKNCDRFKCDFKWKNVKKENGNVKKKKTQNKKSVCRKTGLDEIGT